MKTPRAALFALLALAASAARAADPAATIIPQTALGEVIDYTRPQQSRAWKVLRIERPGATPSAPSIRINPFDQIFLIPARSYNSSFGMTPLLSVSNQPFQGAMRGKPVRLLGSDDRPTGPKLWLPSRRDDDILEQSQRWPAPTGGASRTTDPLAALRSPLDSKALLGKFLSPTGSEALYPFKPRNEPPTFYAAVTNYRYDARKKKVIDADGREVPFTESDVPDDGNGFYLTPPAIPADFKFGDLTFVDDEGEAVDLEKGAVASEPAVAKQPEAPRSLQKLPTAGDWKDTITAIGEWHAVQTAPMTMPPLPAQTFYCYHAQMNGDPTLAAHLEKNPVIVECVDWLVPEGDTTQGAADKRYKVRNYHLKFDLAYKGGKLTTINSPLSLTVTGKPLSSAAIGGEQFIKVTNRQSPAAPTAPASPETVLLSPQEQTWLDKRQAAEYAKGKAAADGKPAAEKAPAITALVKKYRAFVVENLSPNAAAGAAYAAAISATGATPQTIDAALPAEVWGGANSAVVGLFGDRADIQLSKADWDVLSTTPPAKPEYQAALEAYKNARAGADGRGAGTDFTRSMYDPIVLHRSAEAARKLLAAPPAAAPAAEEPVANLNAAELALLTPDEISQYLGLLKAANATPPNASAIAALSKMSAELRATIKADGRAPYAAPRSPAEFARLKSWQKEQYCKPSAAAAADTEAPAATDDAHGTRALPDLIALAGRISAQGGLSDASPAWAANACDKFKYGRALRPRRVRAPSHGAAAATIVPGVDKDAEAKKPNKYFNAELVTSSVKGAMIGLLVGSLFGPPGLVAGPLIGAALFYGLTLLAGGK